MTLVRWTPRTELDSFSRDPFFNRFLDILDSSLGHDASWSDSDNTWLPRLDLVEEKDRLVVHIELPGIDPKDVQVHLQDNVLTVSGERKSETEKTDNKVLSRETSYGAFKRTVHLPYEIQADSVKAQAKNGVMTIVLPKAPEHVGRQIPIDVEK
jgi:HSP20 family protein